MSRVGMLSFFSLNLFGGRGGFVDGVFIANIIHVRFRFQSSGYLSSKEEGIRRREVRTTGAAPSGVGSSVRYKMP